MYSSRRHQHLSLPLVTFGSLLKSSGMSNEHSGFDLDNISNSTIEFERVASSLLGEDQGL